MDIKKLFWVFWFSVVMLWVVLAQAEMGPAVPKSKKLIGWGVNCLSPHNFRDHIPALEKDYPVLDGMILNFWPDDFPRKHWGGNHALFAGHKFTLDDFKQTIIDLKGTEYGRLTENFFWVSTSVTFHLDGWSNIDWFDERWHIIAENVALYATIAKEVGFKGLMLDFEHYNDSTHSLWKYFSYKVFKEYRVQKGMPAVSFEDYTVQVRKCGRQMMEEVTKAYPDITVIMIPSVFEEHIEYDLLPAFVDGILEGAGPKVALIDGGEDGYPKQTYKDFMDVRRTTEQEGLKRSKVPDLFKTKLRYGFGLWLDYNPNQFGGWHTKEGELDKNFRSPERMEHAIYNALSAADNNSYVWLFVWHPDYWWQPSSRGKPSLMHSQQCVLCPHLEGLPKAYLDAIARSREPHDLNWTSPISLIGKQYTYEELSAMGKNLIVNGSFENWSKGADEMPDNWIRGGHVERVHREETGAKLGKYAVSLAKRDDLHMLIDLHLPADEFIGKTIVFGVWCKLTPKSGGSLSIMSKIGPTNYVIDGNPTECPKDNAWHFIIGRQTIPEKAEEIYLRLNAYSYESYAPIQFDGAIAVVEK